MFGSDLPSTRAKVDFGMADVDFLNSCIEEAAVSQSADNLASASASAEVLKAKVYYENAVGLYLKK
jgi:hypothetical protein